MSPLDKSSSVFSYEVLAAKVVRIQDKQSGFELPVPGSS
jgi:hypothetical protein